MIRRPQSIHDLRVQEIAEQDGELLRLRIQRQLRGVNQWSGAHYASKTGRHAESKMWQASIANAVTLSLGVRVSLVLLSPASGLPTAVGACTTRRRVSVQRLTPSARRFLRDDDNLVGAEKPLYDALKRLGLLKDDSTKWVDRVRLPQAVSPDGTFWTIIEIGPADPHA
jgi:hypothetical protein